MILFPAIDLKDGICVRLLRGNMTQPTLFNTSPVGQARLFSSLGCSWLHIVDLNGAFSGYPVNATAIKEILSIVDIPIQLGGGIRDLSTLVMWMGTGIKRVVLGTVVLQDHTLVKTACQLFPSRIMVSLDVRNKMIEVEGWARSTKITVLDFARRLEDVGVFAVVYTDISRDGSMIGPNIEESLALVEKLTIPVVLSGGVSCLEDLKKIRTFKLPGLIGIISGRALYEGSLNLSQALSALS